jgi:OPA family glycerol-3-phosphate transporter-like MFS transporter
VILNSLYTDRVGGKRAFGQAALGVMIMNLLMGACTLLVAHAATMAGTGKDEHVVIPAVMRFGLSNAAVLATMVCIWGINGFFQSFGAIAIVKINAAWFHKNERGKFSGWFGIMIRAGLLLGFSGTPLIVKILPVGFVFFIPALLVAVMILIHRRYVEDSPKQAGITGFVVDEKNDAEGEEPLPFLKVLGRIYANWQAWFVTAAMVMVGFVRKGSVDSWYSKFFGEMNQMHHTGDWPYQTAAWSIAVLGILGGIALGEASDRFFRGKSYKRPPIIAFAFLGMTVMLVITNYGVNHSWSVYAIAVLLGCLSFFVNGAHGLIGGAVSMDFGGKKAAGTAAGMFDGAQYLVAGTLVGSTLGQLLKIRGWSIWLKMLTPFAVMGMVIMLVLWFILWRQEVKHLRQKQTEVTQS